MAQKLQNRIAPPEGGKARRVYLTLHEKILSGAYSDGGALPGEQRLAAQLGVSRVTVRRALDALESEGLIKRRAGAGTVVLPTNDTPEVAADFATLIPQVVEIGKATTARLLSFSSGAAPDRIQRALKLRSGARVQRAERLRLAKDTPFSHLTTWVPEHIAQNYTETDLATTPLYRLLEQSGVKVKRARQRVTATLAAPEVAGYLNVSEGAPLLGLSRVVFDAAGQGVEYLSALYRPDMFRLEMELSREGDGDARQWEPVIEAAEQERS